MCDTDRTAFDMSSEIKSVLVSLNKAMTEKRVLKVDSSTTRGFTNWKDASSVFRKHETSECHCAAVEAIV